MIRYYLHLRVIIAHYEEKYKGEIRGAERLEKALTFSVKCDNIKVFLVVGVVFECLETFEGDGG